jgi:hypothetical protein
VGSVKTEQHNNCSTTAADTSATCQNTATMAAIKLFIGGIATSSFVMFWAFFAIMKRKYPENLSKIGCCNCLPITIYEHRALRKYIVSAAFRELPSRPFVIFCEILRFLYIACHLGFFLFIVFVVLHFAVPAYLHKPR